MKAIEPGRLLDAFRSYSCEPPVGYQWSVEHRMLGFEEFTQLEPWFFCSLEEIRPLRARWPNFKSESDFIPFARRQDGDARLLLRKRALTRLPSRRGRGAKARLRDRVHHAGGHLRLGEGRQARRAQLFASDPRGRRAR